MDYKERIRALREDNDYTQSRIAGLLNIGQNTYADYELGKTRIPVDSLIKLAQFYNVDMNYITVIFFPANVFPSKLNSTSTLPFAVLEMNFCNPNIFFPFESRTGSPVL